MIELTKFEKPNRPVTHDNLPKVIEELCSEVQNLKSLISGQNRIETATLPRRPIGIDETAQILNIAKPTVYALVQKRRLPCYKTGKHLLFFEDELLAYVSNGRRKTSDEIRQDATTRPQKNR